MKKNKKYDIMKHRFQPASGIHSAGNSLKNRKENDMPPLYECISRCSHVTCYLTYQNESGAVLRKDAPPYPYITEYGQLYVLKQDGNPIILVPTVYDNRHVYGRRRLLAEIEISPEYFRKCFRPAPEYYHDTTEGGN